MVSFQCFVFLPYRYIKYVFTVSVDAVTGMCKAQRDQIRSRVVKFLIGAPGRKDGMGQQRQSPD